MRDRVAAVLGVADLPGDDDDTRLRKRVGIAAGLITIVAPLSLPLEAPTAIGLALGVGLSIYNILNLAIVARTRRFDRYVKALIAAGPVFVFCSNAIAGGVTTSGGAWAWAFLTPAYGILALGPYRATPWHAAFLVGLFVSVAFDPVIRTWFGPPSYVVQLAYTAQNVAVPLTIVFFLFRYTDIRRRDAEARSEALLTNAIPRSIAQRLRHGETRIAEAYPATTIVFSDVVGFTPWAGRTDPERVVALLDDLFSRFDALAAACGMEKIKTVGDAYMAVAGAPEPRTDHAAVGMRFARGILGEVAAWRAANGLDLEVRVGVASGPAVGGVIGRQRLLFDLWGATVNTAARMESAGIPGRIQIAASTRALLDSTIPLEPREVDVKGLGAMTTYLLP